jgi:hypothetical protein
MLRPPARFLVANYGVFSSRRTLLPSDSAPISLSLPSVPFFLSSLSILFCFQVNKLSNFASWKSGTTQQCSTPSSLGVKSLDKAPDYVTNFNYNEVMNTFLDTFLASCLSLLFSRRHRFQSIQTSLKHWKRALRASFRDSRRSMQGGGPSLCYIETCVHRCVFSPGISQIFGTTRVPDLLCSAVPNIVYRSM